MLCIKSMPKCSLCSSSYPDPAQFCPSCGAVPIEPKRIPYGGSILLSIVLITLIVFWKIAMLASLAQEGQQSVLVEPPDEAAILIAKCGNPDSDKLIDNSPSQGATRSLSYRKKRVSVVFVHPGNGKVGWRTEAIMDAKTMKPLSENALAKRLPCAAPGTSSPLR